MPTQSTTGLYPFDPYGNAPSNKITYERQTLQTPARDDYFFIIPQAAPFFVNSLVVRNNATGEEFIEGRDYVVGHYFVEAMHKTGKAIAGSIRFFNRNLTGVVSLDYQTIGGQWGFDDQAILEELSNKSLNPLTRAWAQIDTMPALFPPVPHDQSVDDLIGFEDVVESVGRVADAVQAADQGASENHLLDYDNPHQTTKVQVGLGLVANYAVASTLEAQEGTRSDRYMTPKLSREAITKIALEPLTLHTENNNNPHNVTKLQVGLGLVANYPPATEEEAAAGTATNKVVTPAGLRRAIEFQVGEEILDHVDDKNNPHQTTKAQVGLGFVPNYPMATLQEAEEGARSDRFISPALAAALVDARVGNVISHVTDRDNPHRVTKTQVGLGLVENYPMAPKDTALEGTSGAHYMSPLRTTDMLDKFFDERIAPYFSSGDPDNPTGVTKAQVGLGNVENYAVATEDEATTGAINTAYMTPLMTALAIQALMGDSLDNHANNTENPHQVTAEQVGAVSETVLQDGLNTRLPLDGTASNSSMVYGKDEATLTESILAGTAADTNAFGGLTPEEYRNSLQDYYVGFASYDINAIGTDTYVRLFQRPTIRAGDNSVLPSGHISFLLSGRHIYGQGEALVHLHVGEPGEAITGRVINNEPFDLELVTVMNGDIQELWFKSPATLENINLMPMSELQQGEIIMDDVTNLQTATTLTSPTPVVVDDPMDALVTELTQAFDDAVAELTT